MTLYIKFALVEKMKFKRVKWMSLPVKFFDEINCLTEACNITDVLAAREVRVHAAIIESSQFCSKPVYYLNRGPCLKCPE